MGLKTMSLLAGATITPSGGSALVFAEDGQMIQNGVHLIVPADTDYQTRRQLTAKVKQPTLDPKTRTYTGKDKKSISYTQPVVLADGTISFAVLRVEREVPPSMSAANALEMLKIGAQICVDADLADFWANGGLS